MILAIDAININRGGGLTHLLSILKEFLEKDDIQKIILIGQRYTLENIPDNSKLIKLHKEFFDSSYFLRLVWTKFALKKILERFKVDLLFVPGGTFITDFRPIVTMSRNMLPIELKEARRYGVSFVFLRLLLLRYLQRVSYKNSNGFIFLTNYSKQYFDQLFWSRTVNDSTQSSVVIPHGVDSSFGIVKRNETIENKIFCKENPFKIIYVSIIDVYKHQVNVLKAIDSLISKGFWIEFHFVGPSYGPEMKRFNSEYNSLSMNSKEFIYYHSSLNIEKQIELYKEMDFILFA